MQKLISTIENELGLSGAGVLKYASPLAKYLLSVSLWSVFFSKGLFTPFIFLLVVVFLYIYGRTSPFRSLFLVFVVSTIIISNSAWTLYYHHSLQHENFRFAMIIIVLFFGSQAVFSGSTATEHYYFWSKAVGGSLGIAILGFSRSISILPKIIVMTKDAYKVRKMGPLRNPFKFALTLSFFTLQFARSFIVSIDIKDLESFEGYGDLHQGMTNIDGLLILLSILLPTIIIVQNI